MNGIPTPLYCTGVIEKEFTPSPSLPNPVDVISMLLNDCPDVDPTKVDKVILKLVEKFASLRPPLTTWFIFSLSFAKDR